MARRPTIPEVFGDKLVSIDYVEGTVRLTIGLELTDQANATAISGFINLSPDAALEVSEGIRQFLNALKKPTGETVN